jgi:hypothetical protein
MKLIALIKMFGLTYEQILRPMLVDAIDDPKSDWDDLVLQLVDSISYAIINYKP